MSAAAQLLRQRLDLIDELTGGARSLTEAEREALVDDPRWWPGARAVGPCGSTYRQCPDASQTKENAR